MTGDWGGVSRLPCTTRSEHDDCGVICGVPAMYTTHMCWQLYLTYLNRSSYSRTTIIVIVERCCLTDKDLCGTKIRSTNDAVHPKGALSAGASDTLRSPFARVCGARISAFANPNPTDDQPTQNTHNYKMYIRNERSRSSC